MKNLSLNDSGQVEAGELKAEDLPIHEHHLLYYTKEQCEAMFALAQHNHDDRYYTKDDVFTKNETYQNFAPIEHYHNSLYYTKHEVYNKDTSDNKFAPKEHYHKAKDVTVSTFNFNKNLTSAENTVQKALDKLDDMDLGGASLPNGQANNMLYFYDTRWRIAPKLKYESDTYRQTMTLGTSSSNNHHYLQITNNGITAFYYNSTISEHFRINTNQFLWQKKNSAFAIQTKEKAEQGSSYYSVISFWQKANENTLEGYFYIYSDARFQSSFLKGTGTMPLVASSDGTILRGDTPLIKSVSIPFTLTGGGPDGFSFNRLFTWAELEISLQPTLYNMQKKIFSVKAYWRDGSNWKEIENFRHEITGLGLQCTGTVYATTTYLQMNLLYIK